ncbi:hypothetical protein [Alcanivorax sp.]|jgi:hypothetical protein|uniref:hypothetical protein n=1 Tax=Alcanivorax sp. TaxID=1872427 RepID=UPI0032D973AD
MRKNVVLPYTVLRSNSVALDAGSWYQKKDDDRILWLEDGGAVPDWSYDTPLTLGREIHIDGPRLLDELELTDTGASFELIYTLHVSNLRQRKVIHREALDLIGDHRSEFLKTLNSNLLCEQIKLTCSLVLKEDLDFGPRWAPSVKGAVCWQDDTILDLEGEGSRFPMRDCAFSEHYQLPNGAAWHLEWRPALLHYSFNSAVTLLLNSERKEFLDKVQAGDGILVEQVMSAITGEICASVLCSDEFISDAGEHPEGSLGAVARSWLLGALPGKSLSDIKALYEQSPAEVHTALRGLTAGV